MKQRFSYNSPMQVFLTSRWLSHSRTKFLHLIVLLSLRASLVVISSNNRRKKAWRRSSSSVLTHTTSALIYQSEFKLMTCFSVIETKEYSLHGCMHVCPLAQLCPALWDPVACSAPGFPVCAASLHPRVCSNSCPLSRWWTRYLLSLPSPFAFSLSQHQDLFQWVSSLHPVAEVLQLQLQHQSFQWIVKVDFLLD